MTRKQKRLALMVAGLTVLCLAAGLMLYGLKDNISFFKTPSDVVNQKITPGIRFRLGGMVEMGSRQNSGTTVTFKITDTIATLPVTYTGQLPDLFREGQGVITEGKLNAEGLFVADTVLAKHDENYMSRDLADSLKQKGVKLGKGAGQ